MSWVAHSARAADSRPGRRGTTSFRFTARTGMKTAYQLAIRWLGPVQRVICHPTASRRARPRRTWSMGSSPPWWRRRAVPAEHGVDPKVVTEAMRASAKRLRRATVDGIHDRRRETGSRVARGGRGCRASPRHIRLCRPAKQWGRRSDDSRLGLKQARARNQGATPPGRCPALC